MPDATPRSKLPYVMVALLAMGVLGVALLGSRSDGPAPVAPARSAQAADATARRPAAARATSERAPGGEATAVASAAGVTSAVSHRVAYDPTRPLHGGEPIQLPEAPATAGLATRRSELPPCPASPDRTRASGQCAASLHTADGDISVDVRGEVRLTLDGVLHIDKGTATVRNLSGVTLPVVDYAGRRFDVPSLSKLDIEEPPPNTVPPAVAGSAVTPTGRRSGPPGTPSGVAPPPTVVPTPPEPAP